MTTLRAKIEPMRLIASATVFLLACGSPMSAEPTAPTHDGGAAEVEAPPMGDAAPDVARARDVAPHVDAAPDAGGELDDGATAEAAEEPSPDATGGDELDGAASADVVEVEAEAPADAGAQGGGYDGGLVTVRVEPCKVKNVNCRSTDLGALVTGTPGVTWFVPVRCVADGLGATSWAYDPALCHYGSCNAIGNANGYAPGCVHGCANPSSAAGYPAGTSVCY